jgi:HAD superfamily (subfamily IA) hydrolase, TIGR02254
MKHIQNVNRTNIFAPMPAYTTLFFDIDHTLWDFETNSVNTLRILYDEFCLTEKGIADFDDFNAVYHFINDQLWDRFRKGYISRQDLRWRRMWKALLHYKISDEPLAKEMSERYLEILPTQNTLFPHAKETLEYCQQKGYAMHLITNGFEKTQQQKLALSGIDIFFDKMITSEMAMTMKPQKEIFEYALSATQANSNESLMIGDALEIDVLGAKTIGMHQVFFNPKKIEHQDSPTYEIHCLSELTSIV